MTDISSQLNKHLEGGKDWERMDTPVPGLFIVKVPATKTRKARLNLELSPLKGNRTNQQETNDNKTKQKARNVSMFL